MPRVTPFSVGRRWRCTREPGKRDQVFDFVIISTTPKYAFSKNYVKTNVLCRLEVVGPHEVPSYRTDGKCSDHCTHGMVSDYSRAHLKKYGVLQEVS